MESKRIICSVTNDLHQDQRMHRICSALSEAGFEVWLVGRLRASSRPLAPQAYQQHRIPCRWEKGKLFYLEYNLRLLLFLLRHPAHILNAVDLDTLLPAICVSRWRRIPCVYDAHEYFTETPELVRRPRIKKIWEFLAARLIPRTSRAYTVAHGLAGLLSQRYGIPFEVVRNLPARSLSVPAASHSQPYIILYQGMLNEGRGLETAIKAMHQLPECILYLAGDGDIHPQLQSLVATENLATQVRFLGFVAPAELPTLTQQAWLGLNLLENTGLSYYYSLANKALDYIQCGLPSINMNFPEYRHLHQQYGVFVLLDELNPHALASQIRLLLQQPERYEALQEACQQAAPLLCWEHEQAHLIQLYRSL